jgi:hypothetical protein
MLSHDIGFVYRQTDGRTDGHGETSIPPYNFVAGDINIKNTVIGLNLELLADSCICPNFAGIDFLWNRVKQVMC